MSVELLEELQRENLCTHFILPLLKLNKFNFASANFIDSYLAKDSLPSNTRIIVKVVDATLVPKSTLLHSNLINIYDGVDDRFNYLEFSVPTFWRLDITYFRTGEFSSMSKIAKEAIIRHGCLVYKKKGIVGTTMVETDVRILALDRHKSLRSWWESELDITLKDDDELLSIPGEKSYIDTKALTLIT